MVAVMFPFEIAVFGGKAQPVMEEKLWIQLENQAMSSMSIHMLSSLGFVISKRVMSGLVRWIST